MWRPADLGWPGFRAPGKDAWRPQKKLVMLLDVLCGAPKKDEIVILGIMASKCWSIVAGRAGEKQAGDSERL